MWPGVYTALGHLRRIAARQGGEQPPPGHDAEEPPFPVHHGEGQGVSLKKGRVLSNLAGAAEYLKEALLVNPYDLDGMAQALDRALRMPGGAAGTACRLEGPH